MKLIPDTISRDLSRKVLVAKKNSPHIFFAGGLVGVVTSTVLACRSTLRLEKTIHEIRTELEDVKTTKQEGSYNSEREYVRDLGQIYGKSAYRLTRLYLPSIAVGGVSIAALTGAHVQLSRRNAALTVTLGALSQAYEEYRARVIDEIGEERELELYRDVTTEKRKVDGKNEEVVVKNDDDPHPYRFLYDEKSWNWKTNAEWNRMFLEVQQKYANDKLNAYGHVFLNDVLESLGLDHTPAGSVCGWLREGDGDHYIDFGLFEACNTDFYEPRIWLDFNVDGVIWDKI